MPEPILEDMVAEMKRMDDEMKRASELIEFMREVGEPVTDMQADYRKTEARMNKWKAGLRARGYQVG